MAGKNNLFLGKRTLNVRGHLLSLERPLVVAILNVTPDSFFGPSRVADQFVERAGQLFEEGADALDIGGMSTRPGAVKITAQEEMDRVIPACSAISRAFPGKVLSIDTIYAATAEAAWNEGAGIINDVSAGTEDDALFSLAAKLRMPVILMHHQGIPPIAVEIDHPNISLEVFDFLAQRQERAKQAGVHDVLLDPGFGFGKSLKDQYRLLADLHRLQALDAPILVGVSRKSMINKVLGTSPREALNGTTVLHVLALEQGASLLRVHDPAPAREAIRLWSFFRECSEKGSVLSEPVKSYPS